jgi:hypothetical protein
MAMASPAWIRPPLEAGRDVGPRRLGTRGHIAHRPSKLPPRQERAYVRTSQRDQNYAPVRYEVGPSK